MQCEVCGAEFKPEPDEERLMMLGQMGQVCMSCANASEPAKIQRPVHAAIGTGAELFRAEQFTPNHRLVRFVGLPPKPRSRKELANNLRKPKKHRVQVFVMSEQDHFMTTTPPIRLHTNLSTFRDLKIDFYVRKIPSFWDPFTGVGAIEVPFAHIVGTDKELDKVYLRLHDESYIRLQYR